jgi:acyl CoA:acetate/3-ketoacid CoA transferase beta subunit
VEKVDFVTSPGLSPAGNARLKRGGGPKLLVTPRARFTFAAGELTLDAVADGVTREEALEGIPWAVPVSEEFCALPPVTPELGAAAREVLRLWGRGTG